VTIKVWYTFATCKSRSNGRSATLHGMLKRLVMLSLQDNAIFDASWNLNLRARTATTESKRIIIMKSDHCKR